MNLVVQPILRALRDRLRANYVDESLYTDEELLGLLNDGYREACQQSRCLATILSVSLVAGESEYALPADYSEMIYVVRGGHQLAPIPLEGAIEAGLSDQARVLPGFYVSAGMLGLLPTPTETGEATVLALYAATPAALTDYEAAFDARFPVEYADVLLHWVRWRVQMTSGGAERIQAANLDRALFESRVKELRRNDAATLYPTGQLRHAMNRIHA